MSIYLHNEHGVNPTMSICWICGEPKEILLVGAKVKQFKDIGLADQSGKMVDKVCIDKEPCDKCKEWMEQGIICISVKDSDIDNENPYRTGGWSVIKEDAIRRMIKPQELVDNICKVRILFVPDSIWKTFGID